MIRISREYSIKCDNCFEPLEYPNDHPLTSYVGHTITEGSSHHIEEVAADYGWNIKNNKHLCPNCKNNEHNR